MCCLTMKWGCAVVGRKTKLAQMQTRLRCVGCIPCPHGPPATARHGPGMQGRFFFCELLLYANKVVRYDWMHTLNSRKYQKENVDTNSK